MHWFGGTGPVITTDTRHRRRHGQDVTARTSRPDARSLTYRQVSRLPGRWQLTATHVTDPAPAGVLVDLVGWTDDPSD